MQFIEWSDNLLTGVQECDLQHKKLINLFNALYQAVRLGVDKKAIDEAFQTLLSYFDRHFELEEKLMEEKGYPELEQHRNEHQEFKNRIEEMMKEYQAGDLNMLEILKFLKTWWLNHILVTDKSILHF